MPKILRYVKLSLKFSNLHKSSSHFRVKLYATHLVTKELFFVYRYENYVLHVTSNQLCRHNKSLDNVIVNGIRCDSRTKVFRLANAHVKN